MAEQSIQSTKEIADIIKATQERTAKTAEYAQTAGNIVRTQNEAVKATVSVFERIASSMDALSQRINDILGSIVKWMPTKPGNRIHAEYFCGLRRICRIGTRSYCFN